MRRSNTTGGGERFNVTLDLRLGRTFDASVGQRVLDKDGTTWHIKRIDYIKADGFRGLVHVRGYGLRVTAIRQSVTQGDGEIGDSAKL